MSWELRNVGWPIPLPEPWPFFLRNPKPQQNYYIMEHRDKMFIYPYGYTQFHSEYYKGGVINTWS